MTLKRCFLTKNRCFTNSPKIADGKPAGIVVHSTGANNQTLKRYVQPSVTDANYNEIVADIGKNNNGNSWNRSTVTKCVHAMIGVNRAGQIETYETLPYDICAWGIGKGKNGSYNYNPTAHIQFEILEDNLKDEEYFKAVFKEAIEYCAYLCKKFNLSVDAICSHKEAHAAGYGSGHKDCDHWLEKFGKDMKWFRREVKKLVDESAKDPTTTNTFGNASVTLPVIGRGSKGAAVKSLQALLKAKGYCDANEKELVADGVFGANTLYALKTFQNDNGLTIDGYCGAASWSALIEG